MKKNNFLNSSVLFIIIILVAVSCKNDECDGTICENGGTCLNGICNCPQGILGTNCEIFDINQIQTLLNNGQTPLSLINAGIPLDSLYGKTYEGGLIFYVEPTTGTGLVAATADQDAGTEWGCLGTDISDLNNVSSPSGNSETVEGTRIGDGMSNTNSILAACTNSGIAAKRCREHGDDWFLPARGELDLMYTHLREKGHGGFMADWYWSSTEADESFAWIQFFNAGGFQDKGSKGFDARVRAAKAFN